MILHWIHSWVFSGALMEWIHLFNLPSGKMNNNFDFLLFLRNYFKEHIYFVGIYTQIPSQLLLKQEWHWGEKKHIIFVSEGLIFFLFCIHMNLVFSALFQILSVSFPNIEDLGNIPPTHLDHVRIPDNLQHFIFL